MATIKSRKKEGIDPKRYAQILRGIRLDEIYLESCSVTHKRENLTKQKGLEVSIRDSASYKQHNGRVKVTHKYYLTAKKPEMEDFALKISTAFCLVYFTDSPFRKEFFEIFKNTNLAVSSWPYFRELVQNMTQRMNIPPLTLPFLRRG